MLVYVDNDWGIGKVVARAGNDLVVRFFQSIARQTERTYPVDQLERPLLTPQTRVYFQQDDRWRVGRIKEREGDEYLIRLPNHEMAYLGSDDFEVRCLQPFDDPTEVLAIGGAESQYLHDRRRAFMDALVRLRAASRGMTGATSAAIELVDYQLQVARRVLSDPVQRYLLADEVGMGKTIEAGIIIRQCLLDDADATVLVLTPAHLVGQWREELDTRFRIGDFAERVMILAYAELPAEVQRHPPTLLVIDEAHRALASGYTDIAPALRAEIRTLGQTVERLLLLSATPGVGREAELLALLQVLDPAVYGQEAPETFRRKVEQRDKYGLFLRGLRAEASDFLLKQRAREAIHLFADDETVAALASQLSAGLTTGDRATIQRCVGDLRTHIAETYRLHHRLIRTRRTDTEGWEFRPRGPQSPNGELNLSHLRVEVDEDERLPDLLQLLEQWRQDALYAVQQGAEEASAVTRYLQLFEALAQGVECLTQQVVDLATQTPLFAHEPALLASIAEIAAQEPGFAREELTIEILRRLRKAIGEHAKPKVVVFATDHAVAVRLAAALIHVFGHSAVQCLPGLVHPTTSVTDHASAARRFGDDATAWLYVCDRSGEEGQNLQFADAILHHDVPFSADRLEQRIGRLDRFGRRKDVIRHRLLIPNDDDSSPWQAWLELLTDCFQVFNTSLADIQFFLGDLQQRLATVLFREGSAGLRRARIELSDAIVAERQRLDNQYALDRVMAREEAATGLRASIEAAELDFEQGADHLSAIRPWLVDALQFQQIPEPRRDSCFRLHWGRETLMPLFPWHGRLKASGLDQPLTLRRASAVRYPDVGLFRPGHRLFGAFEQFTAWDDRGTTFATWRIDPNLSPDVIGPYWVGFRICWLLEAQPTALANANLSGKVAHALQRRADDLLPPRLLTLYLDTALQAVARPELLTVLERPHIRSEKLGSTDINLGSRPHLLDAIIDPGRLETLCRQVRDRSHEILLSLPQVADALAMAQSQAGQDIAHRRRRIERRLAILAEESAGRRDESLERQIEYDQWILQAIQQPSIRVDAIGLFVLATDYPQVVLGISK
jgi:ATP-dependent helicase HepA